MRVVVVDPDGNDTTVELSDTTSLFWEWVGYECGQRLPFTCTADGCPDGTHTACVDAVEIVSNLDCRAALLVEMAEAEEAIEYRATNDQTFTVLPQLPEARVALQRASFATGSRAASLAGAYLRRGADQTTFSGLGADSAWCNPTNVNLNLRDNRPDENGDLVTRSPAEFLASILVGATRTAELAATSAAKNHHALAQAELSRSSSSRVAAELSWLDQDMSRAAAARMLIGGTYTGEDYEDALYGFTGEGVCPIDEPDEETKEAADLFRALGVDSRDVTGLPDGLIGDRTDVALDALTVASGMAPTESIAGRAALVLGEDVGFDFTIDAGVFTTDATTDEVLSALGTTTSAVTSAREYLRYETLAFARDLSIETAVPLAPALDETTGVVEERELSAYAAMLRSPIAPPDAYYEAIVRFAPENIKPSDTHERPTAAGYAHDPDWITRLIGRPESRAIRGERAPEHLIGIC